MNQIIPPKASIITPKNPNGRNLGLKTGNHKSNPLKEMFANGGGYDEFTEMILSCKSYDEFIDKSISQIKEKYGTDSLDKYDNEALNDFTEEQFWNLKGQIEDTLKGIEKLTDEVRRAEYNEEYSKGLAEYRVPYKKIFNGVFDKLDKDTLTERDLVEFNVHGLPKECWDIFYDKDTFNTVTVYYDYSTKNQNFVEFTKLLKKLGEALNIPNINHKTPLILFDRRLMGIDLDMDLSVEIQKMVYEEERINPIYHFREAARDIDKATQKYVRFELGLANWTVLWLYCQNFNMYHEAPRQTGKTYMVCHILAYEFAVGSNNIKILCAHYNYSEAAKNRADMISKANMFPKFLRAHTLVYSKAKKTKGWQDTNDTLKETGGKNIKNELFDNTLKAVATGKTESSGEQAGRGDSATFIHGDEINFIKYIQAVLTALNFAHSTARLLAEKAGRRACMIFTSTAGNLQTKYGREMYDVIFNQMCLFQLELFGYSYNDLESFLMANAKKRFFVVKYEYDIMGFSEEWFASRLADAPTPDKFETDILQRWLEVSEKSIFSQDELRRIRNRSNNHLEKTHYIYQDYKLVYSPYSTDENFEQTIQRLNHLAIGVDLSEGQGNDSSVMYGINLETARPIFLFNNNQIYAYDMSTILRAFVRDLKDINPQLNIIVIPEVERGGETIMPVLIRDPIMEECLFRYDNPIDPKARDYTIKSYARQISPDLEVRYGALRVRKEFKAQLTNYLFDLVKNYPVAFDFKGVANELGTLIRKPNGNIAADNGFHDDNIMAMLHVYALYFHPKYRVALEKYHHFIIDYRKLEMDPIETHSVYYEDEDKYINTEGKVDVEVISYYDAEDREIYEMLVGTKIVNGKKIELTKEEILHLVKTDWKAKMLYENMKMKPNRTSMWTGKRLPNPKTQVDYLINEKRTSNFKERMDQYEKEHIGYTKRLY